MAQQTDHVPEVRKKVTAVEWLHESNIVICEMLLYGKIGYRQYEQLINCFSTNLEQAKQMEKEMIMKAARQCHFEGVRQSAKTSEEYIAYAEQYYNETYG